MFLYFQAGSFLFLVWQFVLCKARVRSVLAFAVEASCDFVPLRCVHHQLHFFRSLLSFLFIGGVIFEAIYCTPDGLFVSSRPHDALLVMESTTQHQPYEPMLTHPVTRSHVHRTLCERSLNVLGAGRRSPYGLCNVGKLDQEGTGITLGLIFRQKTN